jgi:AraC family transcriptional activator of tynA and feaB
MTPGLKVEQWQEAASRRFVPLIITGTGDDFEGHLETVQVDSGISVSHISHPRARVLRTSVGIKQADDYSLYLSFNVGESFQIVQNDRVVDLPQGTSSFYVSSMPYEMIFPRFASQYVLQVDRTRLPVSVNTQLRSLARPIELSHEGMSILRTYLTSLLSAPRNTLGSSNRVMGQAVVDLTSMVMQSADSGPLDVRGLDRDSLYLGMMSFIRVNASTRNLTPDLISARFAVSRRLMYTVFAENDNSPADAIRNERLRRASVLLGMPGATVRDVALATGFTDVATFGRAFGRQLEMLPSEWIARAQTGTEPRFVPSRHTGPAVASDDSAQAV